MNLKANQLEDTNFWLDPKSFPELLIYLVANHEFFVIKVNYLKPTKGRTPFNATQKEVEALKKALRSNYK